MDRLSPKQFEEVQMNNILAVAVLLTPKNLLNDIDFVDRIIFGELARRMCNNTKILSDY